MKTWIRWIGVLAFLPGCVLSNAGADVSMKENADTGVVVASLGRTGAIEFDLTAIIKPVGSAKAYTVVVDNEVTKKDFGTVVKPPPNSQASDWGYVPASEPYGRLVVVALPAGDYELTSVAGAPPFRQMGTPFQIHSDDFGMRFTVNRGRVTYLGSVTFGFPDWLPLSHYSGPLRIVATDARDRDSKLLREHYPQLGTDLPERSLTGIPDNTQHFRYYLIPVKDGGGEKN